ncbi:unnamed protein product [Symbiodinium pilosum]|uniref:Uncharacterized protein n=1 Tax=Symbiodinium pilosum TaxID=2952 RepID=A0A812LBJ2_SYMPI|nr:unnamed protein product [Symbiodinium pilosum]
MDDLSFLEGILSTKKTQDPGEEDPLVLAIARKTEAQKQRQEASQARWAACQDHKVWLAEKNWRKEVRRKKEEERRRLAQEAAVEEARRAAAARPAEIPAAVRAEEEARDKVRVALQEAQERWLETEWQPQLMKRKQEARSIRMEAEEAARRKQISEAERVRYEHGRMEAEDDAVRAFENTSERECQRLSARAQTPRVAASIARSIEMVLEMRGLEIRWKQSLEERRLAEQEALLHLMEERKERDYREWRVLVHEERLRRLRVQNREAHREASLREWKRLELLGRDALREEELKQSAALEAALVKSDWQKKRLQEQGISPHRVLEEAKLLAEKQRKTLEEVGPKQAEQELWEALLTKNRLARAQKEHTDLASAQVQSRPFMQKSETFKAVEEFQDPRLSFKSMDRGSDGHGLPALKTHSGYVEELEKTLKNIGSAPDDLEKQVCCRRARMAMLA